MPNYRSDALGGRFEFKRTGTFYEQRPFTEFFVIIEFIACLAGYIGVVKEPLRRTFFTTMQMNSLIFTEFYTVLFIFIFLFLFNMTAKGRKWQYEANNRYMRIYRGKTVDNYIYTAIEDVTYKPLMLFTRKRGFVVKVKTKNSVDTFYYIEPRKYMLFSTADTPFDMLLHPPAPFDKNSDNTIT